MAMTAFLAGKEHISLTQGSHVKFAQLIARLVTTMRTARNAPMAILMNWFLWETT